MPLWSGPPSSRVSRAPARPSSPRGPSIPHTHFLPPASLRRQAAAPTGAAPNLPEHPGACSPSDLSTRPAARYRRGGCAPGLPPRPARAGPRRGTREPARRTQRPGSRTASAAVPAAPARRACAARRSPPCRTAHPRVRARRLLPASRAASGDPTRPRAPVMGETPPLPSPWPRPLEPRPLPWPHPSRHGGPALYSGARGGRRHAGCVLAPARAASPRLICGVLVSPPRPSDSVTGAAG